MVTADVLNALPEEYSYSTVIVFVSVKDRNPLRLRTGRPSGRQHVGAWCHIGEVKGLGKREQLLTHPAIGLHTLLEDHSARRLRA